MKKFKYLFFTFVLVLLNITIVSANSIYNIDINVQLDENGTGHITENWNMNVSSKTEVYKVLNNLGNSKITNFTASIDGTPYTYVNNWNVNGSLNDKAYKNGIYHENGDTELCWGMSTYGNHKYTITYDVSNMIYNVNDAQVLYWRFIDNNNMNPKVQQYSVTITGPNKYEDTLDVWGYGNYGGYAFVKNGYIYMSNADNNVLGNNDYVVLLTKFPLNTFNTNNSLSKYKEFNDFYTIAEKGSTDYSENNNLSAFIVISIILSGIINLVIFGGIIVLFYTSFKSNNYIKKPIDEKKLNNFRDIPCEKDLFKAYFLSHVYNFTKSETDLLGAILLSWLKDKKISIVKQEKKKLFGTKEITAIQLQTGLTFTNECEQELYDIMLGASGDNLLEEDELSKWCKNNYSKFYSWFSKVERLSRDEYISAGHITTIEKGKVFKTKNYQIDDYLYEEATKLAGLKKYLIDFSRIKEKQPIEVNLWEYYLIYAQIFGIAKEVAKQFKDLYPELLAEQANGGIGTGLDYGDIIWLNHITASSVSAASSARTAAQSYSSGGGGFSSGGGGGGSFGGGGGGCR